MEQDGARCHFHFQNSEKALFFLSQKNLKTDASPVFDPFRNFSSNFFLLSFCPTENRCGKGDTNVNTKRERCCENARFPFFSPPAFFPLFLPPCFFFDPRRGLIHSSAQDKRKKIIARLFFPAFRKIYVPSFSPPPVVPEFRQF